MIVGIGIDTIEIERFAHWHSYSLKTLQRIFSNEEITYCLSQKNKSAERFAARFATREALYKAYSYIPNVKKVSFLAFCKNVSIQKIEGRPYITNTYIAKDLRIHLSLAHSNTHATAFVIIEKENQQ